MNLLFLQLTQLKIIFYAFFVYENYISGGSPSNYSLFERNVSWRGGELIVFQCHKITVPPTQ